MTLDWKIEIPVEKKLIKYSLKKNIPLLGICRGMQMIAKVYNIKLSKMKGHVGVKHYVFKFTDNNDNKNK